MTVRPAQFRFNVGDKAKDILTGLTGIVTSRSEHLFGCARYWIQPQGLHDGKPIDGAWVDEDAIEILEEGVIVPKTTRVAEAVEVTHLGQQTQKTFARTGGPSNQPPSHSRRER